MRLDRYLYYVLVTLTLACALPGWIQLVLQRGKRKELLAPVCLLTAGVLVTAFFENRITFGTLNTDSAYKFAAVSCPLSVLAIVFARPRKVGRAAPWIWYSAGASLLLWWMLIMAH